MSRLRPSVAHRRPRAVARRPSLVAAFVAAFVAVGLLLAASPARGHAHPGWGIVRDARGDVFYTDLVHVWRIDAQGRRTIAVRDVHTHELMLDSVGALYGEDSEYLGGDRFRHRVWRRAPDGRVTDVLPWRDGFRDDWGFVRGGDGALYWASCDVRADACVVKRRDAAGRMEVAVRGHRFARPLNYLAAARDGTILVADGPDLLRIDAAGRLAPVARALASRDGGRTALMGIGVARDGTVYVAAYGERAVLALSPDGARRVAARSDAPWHPTGVLPAADGLWILEYDAARARVRHVRSDGRARTF